MQPNTTVWYHRHYLHHCLVAVVCNSLWGCRGRSGNSVVTSQATLARWTGVTLVLLCRYLFQPLIIFQDDAACLDAYGARRFHTLLCEYRKDSISPIYNLMPTATFKP